MRRGPISQVVHVTESASGRTLGFLASTCHELDALGVGQTLIYSRRDDTPDDLALHFPARVRLVEVPRASGTHLAFAAGLLRALRRIRPADGERVAVHLHSSKAGFVGRLLLARRRSAIRCLYSPHGLSFVNPDRDRGRGFYRLLERMAAWFPFQPVGDVPDEVVELEELCRRPAYLLESAVNEVFFDAPHREAPRATIASCGPVRQCRDPDALVEMSIAFHIEDLEVDCLWIGSGEREREDRLRAAGVEVTGTLPDASVAERLGGAWVYVQSSQWEDLPLPLYQAMAMGLPCVVMDTFGNRSTIRHRETGFVATSTQELYGYVRLLLSDPELRRRMGLAARAEALQRFSRSRFRRQLSELYGLKARNAVAYELAARAEYAVMSRGRSAPRITAID